MILFSTILPVKEEVSGTDVLEAILEWEETKDIKKEYEELDGLDVYHYTKEQDKKDSIPWTQTFVYEKGRHRLHIVQETDYKTVETTVLENKYVTPSIITLLIERDILNGVKKEPVIAANKSLILPILSFNDKKVAETMAFRLKGAAQVIYSPVSDNKIAYLGKVEKISVSEAAHKVFTYGRLYLYDPVYSWDSLKKLKEYRKTNNDLNDSLHKTEAQLQDNKELVLAYEEEITTLENKLVAANNQLSANSLKISGLENKLCGDEPVLFYGDEKDIYEGETKDIILSILAKEYKNLPDKTRRKDVIEAILKRNKVTGRADSIITQLKAGLKGYKSLNLPLRLMFEAFGFDIAENGEHYKITFQGDDRYLVVLSKTASDHREGKNFMSEVVNTMF